VAQQAEILVDRRRLKRRLSLWRLLAIVAGLGIIAVLVLSSERLAATAGLRSQIVRANISGITCDNREQ
jgi:protease-4